MPIAIASPIKLSLPLTSLQPMDVLAPQQDTTSLSWFDVPQSVKNLLMLAALHWENTEKSQAYIDEALALANGNLDVLIAAYRYFFYKHNYILALEVAEQVLDRLSRSEQFPKRWEEIEPILLDRLQELPIRTYLNAYVASGLALARLGNHDRALEIADRVKKFEASHEFGAAVLFDILTHPEDEEEEE
jgi:tetratricopeptide (TPR) repeat protein